MTQEQPQQYTPDLAALKALAHPLRVAMWEELSKGPSTASKLAEKFAESSGATSYHLRQLARHGFVEEAPGLGNGRERWWRTPKGSVRLYTPEIAETRAGQEAIKMVIDESIRRTMEREVRYQHQMVERLDPQWDECSTLTLGTRTATPAELADLTASLEHVLQEWMQRLNEREAPPEARTVQVHLAAFPLLDEE